MWRNGKFVNLGKVLKHNINPPKLLQQAEAVSRMILSYQHITRLSEHLET